MRKGFPRIPELALRAFIFSFALCAYSAHADSLILHFIHSPLGISWNSPQELAFTTLTNEAAGAPHSIGHAYAEVHCSGEDGIEPFDSLTGMMDLIKCPE